MKIGFDVSQTGREKAGCGFFADSLIRHLARIDRKNEYLLYPTFGSHYWDPHGVSGTCQIDQSNFTRGFGHKTFRETRSFWNNPSSDFEKKLGLPDVIHSNNFFCPIPLQTARLVYTLYDLAFLVHPEWTTEENRIACFDGLFNASIYADFIIAISDYSRTHFLEIFPHYPADRIRTVYPASRLNPARDVPHPRRLSFLQPDQFWLSVGVLEPRKNHKGLLAAYASLKEKLGKVFPLVLAGGKGWLMDDFKKELESLNLQGDVILLGYVPDELLQWLYRNCFAFLYPSHFEGFGLPVIEAMSFGAAVIASNATSVPEIVGHAGILIDPMSQEDLAQAMQKLVSASELRRDFKEKAVQRASRFSWNSAASLTLDCYGEVLSRPRRSSDSSL